jgi:ammonia channel protein AmtB
LVGPELCASRSSRLPGSLTSVSGKQMYKQIAWIAVGFSWCAVVTYLIMCAISHGVLP